MKHTRNAAQRRIFSAVLLFLVGVLLGGTLTVNAAGPYCVAGSFAGWAGPDSVILDDMGGGLYEATVTIPTIGSYEFKITNCTWDVGFPGANAWFKTALVDQNVTFMFNENTLNDGYFPNTNIVHISNDSNLPVFHAPGSVQGWVNNNASTQMTEVSSRVYEYTFTVPNPGMHEFKITAFNNWDIGFNSNGRAISGGNLSYQTTLPNQTVTIHLDMNVSRYKVMVTGGDGSGASQDNNVWYSDLGHNSREMFYRAPGGAVPVGQDVVLRFRSAKNDLTGVQARIWNDRLDAQTLANMNKVASDTDYDYWAYTLDTGTQPTVFYYRFIARDGTATAYYEDTDYWGGWGEALAASRDASWQLTVYDPNFTTPDWVKQAVFYQIFPDRFRDGNAANNQKAGVFFYNEPFGTIQRSSDTEWNTTVCDPRQDTNNACEGSYSRNFYGGDLQGITQQIPYLKELGVTALYLNPIFESPSNHRYDTRDFSRVDDNVGGKAAFDGMMTALKGEGFKVVLDGVFNHTSSDSVYFDRYKRYNDTKFGVGACESNTAPRAKWYPFFPHEGEGAAMCSNNRDYPKWFGIFDSLPVLNTASTTIKNFIYGTGFNHTWSIGKEPIGPYWVEQGIDGWRLDVAPEVDHGMQSEKTDGREVNNPFWEGFRAAIHAVNPEAYIVGEEWGLATSWTSGGVSGSITFPDNNPGEWDATMNYQQSAAILSFWRDTPYTDNDFNTGSSAGPLNPMSASQTMGRLLSLQERYAPEAFYAMMNLFGSHDTNRVMFMLDHGQPSNPSNLTRYPTVANYDPTDTIRRLKGAALMQMTLPGAPTVYYGDEVGAFGPSTYAGGKWEDDPYNRIPYPWLDLGVGDQPFFDYLKVDGVGTPRGDLFAYYKNLIATRKAHPALSIGSFDALLADDTAKVLAYGRRYVEGALVTDGAIVVVNRGASAQNVVVNVQKYLPATATFDDALTDTVEAYAVVNGQVTVPNVPANGGALLVMTSADAPIPTSVPTLTVQSVSTTQVVLAWAAVPDRLYDIYRSTLPGGHYEHISVALEDTFTDTNVTAGKRYYYVMKERIVGSELTSQFSNEVSALPTYDLTQADLVLQWPGSLEYTLNTNAPTDTIYARIAIPGVTNANGKTFALRAQVGYGVSNDPTDPAWKWSEAAYNTDNAGADEFGGALMPTVAGTFYYTARFSSDDGVTWFYAESFSGDANGPVRVLTVNASADNTAPDAPTNLRETFVSSGQLTIAWDASVSTDVAFYRVYRDGTLIATTADETILTFSDETVVDGTTYAYMVTAVDEGYNESAPSSTLSVKAENVLIDVTFRVTVPGFTPSADDVYIVGDQAVWGPWDPDLVRMTKTATPNVWEWTGKFATNTNVTFKFTRGSWDKVQKAADGAGEVEFKETIGYTPTRALTLDVTVLNWRDPIVTAYSPENGANVFADSPISITWNRGTGVTAFSVTSGGVPLVGTYAEDTTTNTVTFTPTVPMSLGTVNVSVSGFSVDSVTQFYPVNFAFNVIGTFALQSPSDAAFFRGEELTKFTWTGSQRPTNYRLIVMKTSNQARIGNVLEKTLASSAVCNPTTFVCEYTLTGPDFAQFTEGSYVWVVEYDGVQINNSPFSFTLDTSAVRLLENGSFELFNPNKMPNRWTRSNLRGDSVVCDGTATVAYEKVCAFRFVGDATRNSFIEQSIDKSLVRLNDSLQFSAAVRTNNLNDLKWVARLQVRFEDGTVVNRLLVPTAATSAYTVLEADPLVIEKPVASITVRLRYVGTAGRLFIDDMRLVATPWTGVLDVEDTLLPLPVIETEQVEPGPADEVVPLPEVPTEGE